ncbi:MAG: hypothetical protein N4A33_04860 [Bacteriovoracaceae bacterium]|jgi:hypothetical protein|nr:hypothetical protein [Bacteriovoracaceae bacterium]
MKKLLLLLFTLNLSYAATKDLLLMTNEVDPGTMRLGIELDQRNDIKSFYISSYNKGKLISKASYSSDISGYGAVVYKKGKRDIVRLVSNELSTQHGGIIIVKYLYNGIKMNIKSKIVDLQRIADQWRIVKNGKIITRVHFKSNRKAILGTIGIKDIQMN